MKNHPTPQKTVGSHARSIQFLALLAALFSAWTGPLPAQVPSGGGVASTMGLQLKNEDMSAAALNKAQASGAKLVRKAIYWSSIETSPGVFNWSEPDGWIASMESRGFTMIITLVWNNRIYEDIYDRAIVTEPGRQAFANWAALVAARYAGKDIIFEIWNEPNLRSFWHENEENKSNTDAMAEEYTELVKDAAPAMKAADPNCRIAAGSISSLWSDSFNWFERCVEMGILTSGIDAISVHPYGFYWPELAYESGYPGIRQILDSNGAAAMPIITSEVGYPEDWIMDRGIPAAQVEEAQAWMFVRQNLVDAMAGIRGTIWYELTDSSYGVLETNLTERPTFYAAQVLAAELSGYNYVQRISLASSLDYAVVFQNAQGQRKLVAWTAPSMSMPQDQKIEASHQVELPVGASGAYAVVDTFGNVTTLTTSTTSLNVTIGGGPVYIPLPDVPTEIILDNTDSGSLTLTGAWTSSSSTTGYYGSNYLHDGAAGKGSKSALFHTTLGAAGDYEVYLRWTSSSNRAANVPVDITWSGGTDAVTVDQRTGGGAWVLLGTYSAGSGSTLSVKVSNTGTSGYVIADAVRIVKTGTPPPPTEIVMDNSDSSGVTVTGAWTASTSTSGYYGTNYLHDGNTAKGVKSVLFQATTPSAGDYKVYLRWTSGSNRAASVPVDITWSGGTDAVSVDQRYDGGTWILLGTYTAGANSTMSVRVSNTGTSGYVVADAVRFLKE